MINVRLLAFCLLATLFIVAPFVWCSQPDRADSIVVRLAELDLEKLKRGEIASARPLLGSFPRGVYVEDCFFVRASLAAVGEKLLHWDTSKHPELEVSILREYKWPTPPNIFDSLKLSSSRTKDKWLLIIQPKRLLLERRTDCLSRGMNLRPRQSRPINATTRSSEFWRKILASRDKAVASGGLNALPHFKAGKIDISIRSEFGSLMKMAPKIAARFQPLIAAKPFADNGNSPDEVVPYWQETLVQGHTTLHAGFLAAVRRSTSWQVADCTYFVSDTYYMSVSFYELLSFENGTLVWQIDFVSAPFRSYLGGTDRFFAGKEMIKGAAKSIRLFRADVEK